MNQSKAMNPAEVYEQQFVPALFQQWGKVVTQCAGVQEGQSVLDVACGTGVLACAAKDITGPGGRVVGVDINEEMLAVAARKNAQIEWRLGAAESLPFENETFSAVVSQFGFMFFEDKTVALQEMWRVLRPQGQLAIAVCDGLDHSPGYSVLAELLQRLFGAELADSFRAPFSCGDRDLLNGFIKQAGLGGTEIRRIDGKVRFDSIESLVATERACVWTLGGLLDDAQFDRLRFAAEESLQPFVNRDGEVEFTMPSLLVTAGKR